MSIIRKLEDAAIYQKVDEDSNVTGSPLGGLLDLETEGQNGIAFNLRAFANTTPYVKQPLNIQLTRAPKAFQYHRDGAKLTAVLKRLIERGAKNWTGFVQVLEIETAQIPVGWDRQMLTVPTNTARGPMQPSATFDSMYEEADVKFWRYYIETFIKHPTLQRPNFSELQQHPKDWLIDMYTWDMIAWEPNQTYTKAEKAWGCAGCFPTNAPEVTGERDTQNASKIEEYTLTFACLYDSDENIVDMATQLMTAMKVNSINPRFKPSFIEAVDQNVVEAKSGIFDEYVVKDKAHPANAVGGEGSWVYQGLETVTSK